MPATKKSAVKAAVKPASRAAARPSKEEVEAVVASLARLGNRRIREEMGPRYGIHTDKAWGVSVGDIRKLAKELGQSHALAAALWATGWYEARMLACFVDEPAEVTPAQMDRWAKDFDNWGICDTACFHLFDRTPQAYQKVEQWAGRREEFVKRAAFALLASLAGHDKKAGDEPFLARLPLIEQGAGDERDLVKKGVSWALRRIGGRSPGLRTASLALSKRLAASSHAAERWVGKDALRDLNRPLVAQRAAKGKKT